MADEMDTRMVDGTEIRWHPGWCNGCSKKFGTSMVALHSAFKLGPNFYCERCFPAYVACRQAQRTLAPKE